MKLVKNTEALRLYREILRTTRLFTYKNEAGDDWSLVLKREARKEFEQARYETDNELIARLLFVGWDCVNQTKEKFAAKSMAIDEELKNPSKPPSNPNHFGL